MDSKLHPTVSNSDSTARMGDSSLSREGRMGTSTENKVQGNTILGSTKLNDMYEAAKGPGIKYAAAAAKIGECERQKHSREPPSYIPESDTAGLVPGSSGPSINDTINERR